MHVGKGDFKAGGPCFAACMLLCFFVFAVHPYEGCSLLLCCCVGIPCLLGPGDPTGQRWWPLLMLILSVAIAPSAALASTWFLGSSVMVWDPRSQARQAPGVRARCPVTPVDGIIGGCDYTLRWKTHHGR